MDSQPGELLEAQVSALAQKVRAQPVEPRWRMGLFQRLCQLGRWHKALEQLQAWARLQQGGKSLAQFWRLTLQQELLRERVFRGELDPPLPEEVSDWVPMLAGALKSGAAREAAAKTRAQALDLAPTSTGTMDGVAFEWLADADERLGPVCEAIVNGLYQWIPFELIASIHIPAPANAVDLVWLPASLKLRGDQPRPVLIPARYPLLDGLSDAHLRSSLTTWEEDENACWVGRGVRVLTTDAGEKSMLDIRSIDFDEAG